MNERKILTIIGSSTIIILFIALCACLIIFENEPTYLTIWTSFIGVTLSLVVLIIAGLVVRGDTSPSQRYNELFLEKHKKEEK